MEGKSTLKKYFKMKMDQLMIIIIHPWFSDFDFTPRSFILPSL